MVKKTTDVWQTHWKDTFFQHPVSRILNHSFGALIEPIFLRPHLVFSLTAALEREKRGVWEGLP